MKNNSFLLLLFVIGLTGCAASGALPSGEYVETFGPRVVSFSSKELRLYPNHQFEYIQWTDMVGVGGQGKGTYTLRGRHLRLVFEGQSVQPSSAVQAQLLPAQPGADSVTVLVALRVGKEATEGLTVVAFDATGRMLTSASSNQAGRARICLAQAQHPHHFTVTGIGFQDVEQPWPLRSTAYDVQLAARLGPAYQAGKLLDFRVLHQSAARLVLCQGTDTSTLVPARRP